MKSQRGRQIPWSCCYRCLWTYWQDQTWVFSIRAIRTLNCPTISLTPILRFYIQINFLSVVYHQGHFNLWSCVLDVFAKTRKCQASYFLTASRSSVRCHDVESQPAFPGVCSHGKTTLSPHTVVRAFKSACVKSSQEARRKRWGWRLPCEDLTVWGQLLSEEKKMMLRTDVKDLGRGR